jgi:hypothetical protein
MAEDRPVVVLRVEPGRALAEHLFVGEQLLVDFEADSEPDLVVINGVGQDASPVENRLMIPTKVELGMRN